MGFDLPIEVQEGRCPIQCSIKIVACGEITQYPLGDHPNCFNIETGGSWLRPIISKVLKGWGPLPSCITSDIIVVCDDILGER